VLVDGATPRTTGSPTTADPTAAAEAVLCRRSRWTNGCSFRGAVLGGDEAAVLGSDEAVGRAPLGFGGEAGGFFKVEFEFDLEPFALDFRSPCLTAETILRTSSSLYSSLSL